MHGDGIERGWGSARRVHASGLCRGRLQVGGREPGVGEQRLDELLLASKVISHHASMPHIPKASREVGARRLDLQYLRPPVLPVRRLPGTGSLSAAVGATNLEMLEEHEPEAFMHFNPAMMFVGN